MMTSTMMTTTATVPMSAASPSTASASSQAEAIQQQLHPQEPLASSIICSVTPIEDATHAFAQTITLNNAGATLMEREDYVGSIRALTSSFLAFKKTYTQQKNGLVSLRKLIQEAETIKAQHNLSTSNTNPSSSSSPYEALIFNVDELFSWRRAQTTAAGALSCSNNIHNNPSDLNNRPLCHSYRRSPGTTDRDNEEEDGEQGGDDDAFAARSAVKEMGDDEADEEQDVASVYSNPIHLPPDFPITQESCGFLSTTITLNLALANHLYGLELQGQQNVPVSLVHEHLTSAGRYYEYTIRLERARQQEELRRMTQSAAAAAAVAVAANSANTSSHASSLPPLFISPFALLVILNNLGQLHLSLSNKDRSQKCYRQLQSTLMFLLVHSSKHTTSLTEHSRDLAVFMENATLGLQSMSSRPMAAAA